MTTLTDSLHTAQLFPAHDLLKPSVTFFIGVEAGRCHTLPIGAVFGCVYSPSQFCLGEDHWRYVRFRVKLCTFRKGQELERGYAVIGERPLTEDEVQFFEGEWLEAQGDRQDSLSLELG